MVVWNGASVATIQQQNAVAQQALTNKKISQSEYNRFKAYQDEQEQLARVAETPAPIYNRTEVMKQAAEKRVPLSPVESTYYQRDWIKAAGEVAKEPELLAQLPTGAIPTKYDASSRTVTYMTPEQNKQYQESAKFYINLGYPQLAGKYEPIDVPKGAKITSIKETPEGLTIDMEKPSAPELISTQETGDIGAPIRNLAKGKAVHPTWDIKGSISDALGVKTAAPSSVLGIMQETETIKTEPVSWLANAILTDVGLLSVGINPAAGLLAGGIGSAITEGINVATTGESLTPQELLTAGIQSAGFSAGAGLTMKGASSAIKAVDRSLLSTGMKSEIIPAFRDILGISAVKTATKKAVSSSIAGRLLYKGMTTEISPVFEGIAKKAVPVVGRAGFMGGFGAGTGYVLSSGDIEETKKSALLGAGLSLGLEFVPSAFSAITKGIKTKIAKSDIKPVKKTPIMRTALEFEAPPPVDYETLPTALAIELKRIKASEADPLYRLLFPKDAMKAAEQRYGSIREVPEAKVKPLTEKEGMSMLDALFPERATLRAMQNAEARYGSAVAKKVGKAMQTFPEREYSTRSAKWKQKALLFEAGRTPKTALENEILGRVSNAETLKALQRNADIYDIPVTSELFPERGYSTRVAKWSWKAQKFATANEGSPVFDLENVIMGKQQAKTLRSLMKNENIYDIAKTPELIDRNLQVRLSKWLIRGAKFQNIKDTTLDFDAQQAILGKLSQKPTLRQLTRSEEIYSKETVPYVKEVDPLEGLSLRQQRWVIKAVQAGIPKNMFVGETVIELPKTLEKYILGKAQKKPTVKPKAKTSTGTKEIPSAGQILLEMEKPIVEVKTKTEAKATIRQRTQPQIVSVADTVLGTRTKAGTPHRVAIALFPSLVVRSSAEAKMQQAERQIEREISVADEILGSLQSSALKQPSIEVSRQKPRVIEVQEEQAKQRVKTIQKLDLLNLQVLNQRIPVIKKRRIKKVLEVGSDLFTKPTKRIYKVGVINLLEGIPLVKRASVKLASKHKRKRRGKGKR